MDTHIAREPESFPQLTTECELVGATFLQTWSQIAPRIHRGYTQKASHLCGLDGRDYLAQSVKKTIFGSLRKA